MNRTKIDWADYSWNPVVGCRHGCWYCYARRIAKRLYGHFEPTFFAERLNEPVEAKKASKIFVCSMADLFGEWVEKSWVLRILATVCASPQHTFYFLTKNPIRYHDFAFPINSWLGVTIDGTEDIEDIYEKLGFLESTESRHKFVSFEPLLNELPELDLSRIDLVIVGAMTGVVAVPPKQEWIESIKHPNIFFKENIKSYLKEPE